MRDQPGWASPAAIAAAHACADHGEWKARIDESKCMLSWMQRRLMLLSNMLAHEHAQKCVGAGKVSPAVCVLCCSVPCANCSDLILIRDTKVVVQGGRLETKCFRCLASVYARVAIRK